MFTVITSQVFTRLYKTLQDLQDPLLSRFHSGRPWWTWWTWDWAHWARWALFWSQPLDAPWRDARWGRFMAETAPLWTILIHCDPFWTYFEHMSGFPISDWSESLLQQKSLSKPLDISQGSHGDSHGAGHRCTPWDKSSSSIELESIVKIC